MSKGLVQQFDTWLADSGPVALTIREWLVPVEGRDGVVFPPTFAAREGQREGGYNIDDVGAPGAPRRVALMDSVGSQANRIEPLFKKAPFAALVPQITVQAGDQIVNLLDAGHRAADAIVRYSSLGEELSAAFRAWQREGDATLLAKIAPTSLLFGAWDSRDTQAKLPRLLASTIRAFGVKELKRSAQYVPPVDYQAAGLVEQGDKKHQDVLSELGFRHAPAAGTHGGVLVEDHIRRDTVLSLVGLRALAAGSDDATRALQRYILGLGLAALAAPRTHDLRQGCLLTPDPDAPARAEEVGRDGRRRPLVVDGDAWRAFAASAAEEFGVGPARRATFEPKRAAAAIKEKRDSKKKGQEG